MSRTFTNTYCEDINYKENLKERIKELVDAGAKNIRIGLKVNFEIDVLIK